MLIVAAFEARSETESAFTVDSFNSSRMNIIALAEVAGAFLITQADFMNRLLGTTALQARQWGLGLLAAVVLAPGVGARQMDRTPQSSGPDTDRARPLTALECKHISDRRTDWR